MLSCQLIYQVSGRLIEHHCLVTAVKEFIRNFEAKMKTRISNYFIERILSEGTYSLSGIVRLKFEYGEGTDTKTNSVIIKIPSLSMYYSDPSVRTKVYEREVLVYQKILPAMYMLHNCQPFSAKLYATTEGSTLVMEDLSASGFLWNDKQKLNLDQIKMTLKLLAQFHALGYTYLRNGVRNDPSMSVIESFQLELNDGIDNREYSLLRDTVKPYLSAILIEKIWNMKDEVLAYPQNINPPDENTMTVIIHGDMHAENILFKYDKGEICQVKIIDWQFARHASPILDLMFFFIKCVPIDTFVAHENDLIDLYLTTLNSISLLPVKHEYKQKDLNRDMFQYRYNYLRLLALVCDQGSRTESQESWLLNIVNWLVYLERKGFIQQTYLSDSEE